MKIVIIDNYDSFTYNLSHLVKELGAEVTVMRNDSFKLEELKVFDKIILSPGPGIPSEAGLLPDVIRTYTGKKPILGVCLGEQAIGEVFGAKLINLSEVFHGVQTPITIEKDDDISFPAHSCYFQTVGEFVCIYLCLPYCCRCRISCGKTWKLRCNLNKRSKQRNGATRSEIYQ